MAAYVKTSKGRRETSHDRREFQPRRKRVGDSPERERERTRKKKGEAKREREKKGARMKESEETIPLSLRAHAYMPRIAFLCESSVENSEL